MYPQKGRDPGGRKEKSSKKGGKRGKGITVHSKGVRAFKATSQASKKRNSRRGRLAVKRSMT